MNFKELSPKTIDLRQGTESNKRKEILSYFNKTFELDDKLYEILKYDKTFYLRADPLRHPLIFYYGHTAAFYINKLILAKMLDERINHKFESIFAIGVDEMSWDDLDEKNYDWPDVEEVAEYRKKVKETVSHLINTIPFNIPIDWDSLFWVIMMGIEHQRIHIETSSVLIRQLPVYQLHKNKFGAVCTQTGKAPENQLIDVEAGKVKLGKPFDHKFYGWDNEYGSSSEEISTFKAAKYVVSNQEFLDFIDDKGYKTEKWWTKEGWAWRNYKKAEHPLFWIKKENKYQLRLMTEIVDMPWNWPVVVNYLEAKAFCNWKSYKTGKKLRLPTEAEWYRLYEHCQLPGDVMDNGNINLAHYASSCPVDMFKSGKFFDITGNVWQWTETPIAAFPGFSVHKFYDDFSTPTFDGKHNLIKGGSWISTGNEATKHSRYAFRRHFYQHAGFRYIETDAPLHINTDMYETDAEVAQSCELNYGNTYFDVSNFQKKIAEISISKMNNRPLKRALDLNTDTGRMAFELARHFEHVTGLDFTARYIRMAFNMQERGFIRYVLKDEGELPVFVEKHLKDFGLGSGAKKVEFAQADPVNLKPKYMEYNLIVAVNLLEEMYNPLEFLKNIHKRMAKNGLLIIGSTYNWSTEYTKKENWPGGFKKDGEPVKSLEGMENVLSKYFLRQKETIQIPLVKRINAQNFEYKLSELSFWELKE